MVGSESILARLEKIDMDYRQLVSDNPSWTKEEELKNYTDYCMTKYKLLVESGIIKSTVWSPQV